MEAAIEAIRPAAESRKISLDSELSTEVGSVFVDPDRIQQVVWNLFANAVKLTPQGGRVAGCRRDGIRTQRGPSARARSR